jgi:outer membrane murein-binding lipoprotein Lpp
MPPETGAGGSGKRSDALRKMAVPETTTGGDGPDMLEGRLARLEGLVEGLKTSQTITFSAVALVGAMLLALGSWTVVRIDGLAGRMDSLSARIDGRIDSLAATIDGRIDSLAATIDGRIEGVSGNIADLNSKVDQLPARIGSDLQAIVATLSQAVTAAKQPPQIIVMPAQPAAPAADPAKPAGTP